MTDIPYYEVTIRIPATADARRHIGDVVVDATAAIPGADVYVRMPQPAPNPNGPISGDHDRPFVEKEILTNS